jgi:alanine racemase
MAVVKADAYGHGLAYAARAVIEGGAQMLAVAIVEEAVALREAGFDCPILILGGAGEASIYEAVRINASQAVFTPDMLIAMENAAQKCGVRAKAHLKIDTGMSRIGVKGDTALSEMLDTWKNCPDVEMEGMFTHFCVSETDKEFTDIQNGTFEEAVAFYQRLEGKNLSNIDSVELVTNATNTSTNVINSFKEALTFIASL